MSAWDGLLGQIWSNSTRVDIGKGTNFTGGLEAEYNATTGLVDVRSLSGGSGTAQKFGTSGTTTGADVEAVFSRPEGSTDTHFLVMPWARVTTAATTGTVIVAIETDQGYTVVAPEQSVTTTGQIWLPSFGVHTHDGSITTYFTLSGVTGTLSLQWAVMAI